MRKEGKKTKNERHTTEEENGDEQYKIQIPV